MRELVLKVSISIDGCMARPGIESDWMFRAGTPDSAAWVLATLADAGTHLWGRSTFEFGAGFWPTAQSPMAVPTNAIPKAVVTRQAGYDPATAVAGAPESDAVRSWASARVLSGELAEEVARLKAEDGGYVLAQGGTALVRGLVRAGLVDEYRLVVLPVALGSGDSPFSDLDRELDLELTDSTRFAGGVIANVYRPR